MMPIESVPAKAMQQSAVLQNPRARVIIAAVSPDEVRAESRIDAFRSGLDRSKIASDVNAGLVMAARRLKSAVVIPVNDRVAEGARDGISTAVGGVIDGIRIYFDNARRSSRGSLVTEVIIAAGAGVFSKWLAGGGTLSGLFSAGEDSALAGPHSAELESWARAIADRLVGQGPEGFSRSSPFSPAPAQRRTLVAVFDAGSGAPISIDDAVRLPEARELAPGQAAIGIEYVEDGGAASIRVSRNVVSNSGRISRSVLEIVSKIPTTARSVVSRSLQEAAPDGLIPADCDIDSKNRKFVSALIAASEKKVMTMSLSSILPLRGKEALVGWLSARTDRMSAEDMSAFMDRRMYGYRLYDISIDESGRFIGASMHMDDVRSPRSTVYNMGVNVNAAASARDVEFRAGTDSEGAKIMVPVSFEWHGRGSAARAAFQRWFDSPEFKRTRGSMTIEDRLSEIMFPGGGAAQRLKAFLGYLESAPYLVAEALGWRYDELNRPVESMFTRFIGLLKRPFAKGREIKADEELGVALLEMLLRRELGEAEVDRIIRPRPPKPPRGSGGSGAPPVPRPGGRRGAPPSSGNALGGSPQWGAPGPAVFPLAAGIAQLGQSPLVPASVRFVR